MRKPSSCPVVHKSLVARILITTLFVSLSLGMNSCNSSGVVPENTLQGPTNNIIAPEVMPVESGIKIQSTVQSDLNAVFSSAQKVYPPKVSDTTNLPNGYTLTFFDFYGVSFAYVNQISRVTSSLDPQVLAARHNPNVKAPEEEKTWTDGTYVTGANTRRTTMGSYTHGFPVLYGLYSQESQKKGFRIADVTKYVMPIAGYYWVFINSGRYFDLLARDWVDAKKVETFRQAYDSILDKLSDLTGHEATMTKNWTAFNAAFKVRPSNCLGTLTNDKCVQSAKLAPATLAPFCATRWFLWMSWLDCGFTQGAYTSTGENLPSLPLLTNFLTISVEDNDQFQYPNTGSPFSGCGPKAGQNLLKWWKTYGGSSMANALRPAGGGFTADENTQIELINDMGAYVSGNQRVVNNSGCVGLQQYITRHNIPLGIVCIEGLIVINNWIQQFKNAFSWNRRYRK